MVSKDATNGAPGIANGNKKLLGAPGSATRSKDATRGPWQPDKSSQDCRSILTTMFYTGN